MNDNELGGLDNGLDYEINKDMELEELEEKVKGYQEDLNNTEDKLDNAEELNLDRWYKILEKEKEYSEKLDTTLKEAMNRGIENFDFDFLKDRDDIDIYELADQIIKDEISEEDAKTLLEEKSYNEFMKFKKYVEEAGESIKRINHKVNNNKGLLVQKARELYENKNELQEIKNDHYEASIASIMAMLEDKLGGEAVGYEEAKEAYELYEKEREEKDLPPLTVGMLSGLAGDKELRDKCLLSSEALTTEIKDPSDLVQTYEIIDAVENPDYHFELKGNVGAGITAGLLLGAAVAGAAALPEDTELEWDGGPTLAEYSDLDTDITGGATQENLTITGTVEGGDAQISLEPVNIGGSLGLEDTKGNLFVNDTTGQVEFGTGNVSQIINATDGNVWLNETEGFLEINEGELAGRWEQINRSELDAEVEEIDLEIDAQTQGEQKTQTSLIPALTASVVGGGVVGYLNNKLNQVKKKEDEDLAEFVTRKYNASREIEEASREAFKDFYKEMREWEKEE
ncbi:MAG: hypothetical protein ACLFQ8_00735 [Candidatus Aenigmatarchaeota archaeon]